MIWSKHVFQSLSVTRLSTSTYLALSHTHPHLLAIFEHNSSSSIQCLLFVSLSFPNEFGIFLTNNPSWSICLNYLPIFDFVNCLFLSLCWSLTLKILLVNLATFPHFVVEVEAVDVYALRSTHQWHPIRAIFKWQIEP